MVGGYATQYNCYSVSAVLGRFLHSLNKFCHEEYGALYDIPDYSVYEFAKVRGMLLASPVYLVLRTSFTYELFLASDKTAAVADLELLNG